MTNSSSQAREGQAVMRYVGKQMKLGSIHLSFQKLYIVN